MAAARGGGWEGARARLREWSGAGLLGKQLELAEGRDLRALRALLLPFWEFTADVGFRFRAAPRDGADPGAWSEWEARTFCGRGGGPGASPAMQVGASYALRQDLLEAAKPCGPRPAEFRAVKLGAAAAPGDPGLKDLEWEPCEMRRGLAWQLALSRTRRELRQEAARSLSDKPDASPSGLSRHVQLEMRVHRRSSRCVYYPAFFVEYECGTRFGERGRIVPEVHQALVGLTPGAGVAMEAHTSPLRAQILTGATLGAGGLAIEEVARWAFDAPWAGVEGVAVLSFVGAVLAGVAARSAVRLRREATYQQRLKEDAEFGEDWADQGGLGLSPESWQATADDAEWARWEEFHAEGDVGAGESDSGESRRKWAGRIWDKQHERRRALREHASRAQWEELRREEEARREHFREKRWGGDAGSAGARSGAGWHSDALGYFRALDLDPSSAGGLSDEEVKKAFKAAAKRMHPDLFQSPSEKASAEAAFKDLHVAYQALKCAEERQRYQKRPRGR